MHTTRKEEKCLSNEASVRSAQRVTWIGFWVNTILGVAKVTGGVLGHSSALIADGIHSFSDFLSDIIVLVMVRIARKSPDKEHNFGHGRYETLATIMLALILLIVAVGIFYDGLMRVISVIQGEVLPAPGMITLIILLAAIASKEWLFRITRKVGREIHSEAVIANAWHHRSDSMSSIATLTGVAGAMFLGERWRVLDPIAAMVVAIFIAVVGIQMMRPAISELLGASLPQQDRKIIEDVLNGYPQIKGWHNLRTFKSGKDAYIEVHIKVDAGMTVKEAHDIATCAERKIHRALTDTSAHVTTHIEPYTL